MRLFTDGSFVLVVLAVSVGLLAGHAEGAADLLWHNFDTGDVGIWYMDGTSLALNVIITNLRPDAHWGIMGRGDFDGNGTTDIVWRNSSWYDVAIWFMDGPSLIRSIIVANDNPLGSSWTIRGFGDFDGDGKTDILWQHLTSGDVGMWLMDGPRARVADIVAAGLSTSWFPRVGDFDGDGDDDILWFHSVTGDAALWLTNGLVITQASVLVAGVDTDWSPNGIGDFNGDGIDDLFWINTTADETAVWLMNGMAFPNGAVVPGAGVSGWAFRGVVDVNGDGLDDVLWRNIATGDVGVWIMNGQTLVAGVVAFNPLVPISALNLHGAGEFGDPEQAYPH